MLFQFDKRYMDAYQDNQEKQKCDAVDKIKW